MCWEVKIILLYVDAVIVFRVASVVVAAAKQWMIDRKIEKMKKHE